ncbi:hypothetical protein DM01DRAFT_1333360 [Hesseltinella vesiculosa]|uniref:F-box domain-containing protein n=1 Tax=Hesseltinella vesiculosa TaxID=101127 RepID=A0A1X2GPQ4_9FUNG|nr:hypothetical protein DM01DRAFT_1333360 [Hesseltinella vesiculosa]
MKLFLRLPLEILELITDRLTQDDIFELCCTSRINHNHIIPLLYRHITLNDDRQLQCLIKALSLPTNSIAKSLGHVAKSLKFRYHKPPLALHSLDTIAGAFPSLTSLEFSRESWTSATWQLAKSLHAGKTVAKTTSTCSAHLAKPYGRIPIDLTIPEDARKASDIQALIYISLCEAILYNHPHLTSLKLDLSTYLFDSTNERLYTCLSLLPTGLTELTLYLLQWELTFDHVECIHDRCPWLEALSLDHGRLVEGDIAIPDYPSLEMNHVVKKLSINLEGETRYYWPWFWYVGKKYGRQLDALHFANWFSSAERLAITREQMIAIDTCAITFAQQHASTLRCLELTNMMIFDAFWAHMKASCDISPLVKVKMSNEYLIQEPKEITIGSLSSHLVRLSMLDYVKTWVRKLELSVAGDDFKMHDVICAISQCLRLTSLSILGGSDRFEFVSLPLILDLCPQLHTYTMKHQRLHDNSRWPIQHGLVSLKLEDVGFEVSQMNRALGALYHLQDLVIIGCDIIRSRDSWNSKKMPALKLTFLNPNMSVAIIGLSHDICSNGYYLAVESHATAPSYYWVNK